MRESAPLLRARLRHLMPNVGDVRRTRKQLRVCFWPRAGRIPETRPDGSRRTASYCDVGSSRA
jgi:hypothetical protein